jgi:hypothetical protein
MSVGKIAQHSSKTNEHPTPVDVVNRARRLMGGRIDLDPASCATFNKSVGAETYFRKRQDGIRQKWHGRVFLNPPGGKLKMVGERWKPVVAGPGESSMRVWWEKLSSEWAIGRVEQAFFVGFTLEILRTSQACGIPVQAFPRVYPRARMAFGGDRPTHANVLVYLPPRGTRRDEATHLLRAAFGDIGLCEGSGVEP